MAAYFGSSSLLLCTSEPCDLVAEHGTSTPLAPKWNYAPVEWPMGLLMCKHIFYKNFPVIVISEIGQCTDLFDAKYTFSPLLAGKKSISDALIKVSNVVLLY